jgi:hypothetical protein
MSIGNWRIDFEEELIIWEGVENLSISKHEIFSRSLNPNYLKVVLSIFSMRLDSLLMIYI